MNASRFSVELGFITVHFLAQGCVLVMVEADYLPPLSLPSKVSLWEFSEEELGNGKRAALDRKQN